MISGVEESKASPNSLSPVTLMGIVRESPPTQCAPPAADGVGAGVLSTLNVRPVNIISSQV